jgi:hypothetical protein
MQDHYRDITKEDFARMHLETISVTNYPMVGETVVTLSFSAYELGFYHFRMPSTMAYTIAKKAGTLNRTWRLRR